MQKSGTPKKTLGGKPTRASQIEKQFYSRIEQFISTQYSNPTSKDSSLRKANSLSNNSSLQKWKGHAKGKKTQPKQKQKVVNTTDTIEKKMANKNRLKTQLQKIQSLKQEMMGHKHHSECKYMKSVPLEESAPQTNQVYIKLESSQIGINSYQTPDSKKWQPSTQSPINERKPEGIESLQKDIAVLKVQKQSYMDEILKNIMEKGETIKKLEQYKSSLANIGKEVHSLQQQNVSLGIQYEQTQEKMGAMEKMLAHRQEVFKQVRYGRLKISEQSLENMLVRYYQL